MIDAPNAPAGGDDKGGGTSAGEFAGLGLQFAVSIIAFFFVGQWLDGKFGTTPWLLIIGVFLGGGASFYSMYRKLSSAQARDDVARKARRDGGGGG